MPIGCALIWGKIIEVKQSSWTLSEARTKKGRWSTGGPSTLRGPMKEFKTIDEQVAILESRGMKTDERTPKILLKENYYSVINGYKDPFLDKIAMQKSADDIYKEGTEFNRLYNLFTFDRKLRQITFSYLIQAEAALKTATVYAFCERHQGCSDYLDRSSFCAAEDMLVPRAFKGDKASKSALHSKSLNYLMGILNRKLVLKDSTRPFTAHYLVSYGEVPLWVLANDLTFGNLSHFGFLCQQPLCHYDL